MLHTGSLLTQRRATRKLAFYIPEPLRMVRNARVSSSFLVFSDAPTLFELQNIPLPQTSRTLAIPKLLEIFANQSLGILFELPFSIIAPEGIRQVAEPPTICFTPIMSYD